MEYWNARLSLGRVMESMCRKEKARKAHTKMSGLVIEKWLPELKNLDALQPPLYQTPPPANAKTGAMVEFPCASEMEPLF